MSFLNAGLLWALPLALAPLILHLLFRGRHRPVVFSDNALLRQAAARAMPRRRLEEWVLVVLRTAAAVLLVLFSAGPLVHWGLTAPPAEEKTGLDLVVLLDSSYSMGATEGGVTRFDRAKAAAAAALKMLRPQDRAAVISFSDRIEGSTGELDDAGPRLLDWLERARPTWHGTDYRLALEAAFSLLSRSSAARKAVIVLSDNAGHGWRGLDPADAPQAVPFFDPTVPLAGLAWKGAAPNAWIEPPSVSQRRLLAQAALTGEEARESDLTLVLDGRAAGKRRLSLKRGATPASFDLPDATGTVAGAIELRRDALGADDAAWFAAVVRERPRVLVLEPAGRDALAFRDGFFLRRAAQTGALPADLDFGDPADLGRLPLRDYRAAVLLAWPSDAGAARLEQFVREGGGLWVLPSAGAPPPALEAILPARLSAGGGASGLAAGEGVRPPGAFDWSEFELEKVEFRRAWRLLPREGSEVWFKAGRGEAALAASRLGAGVVALSNAPLDPGWTDLPLKPVFPALAGAALTRLAGARDEGERTQLLLEQVYTRSWTRGGAPLQAVVTGPDRLTHQVPISDGRLQFARTDLPGLYRLRAEGPGFVDESVFAVNLDPALREGDLAADARAPWTLLAEETFGEDLARLLFGREVRHVALAGLLLLLAAESLLVRKP